MTQEEIIIKSLNMSLEDIQQHYVLIREGIRNYLHKMLEGATEEHPLKCDAPLEFGAEGLSTLEMNHVTGLFRDSEGINGVPLISQTQLNWMDYIQKTS